MENQRQAKISDGLSQVDFYTLYRHNNKAFISQYSQVEQNLL
jgi:hypothetical protein